MHIKCFIDWESDWKYTLVPWESITQQLPWIYSKGMGGKVAQTVLGIKLLKQFVV